jgi:hypothetical protein
MLKSIEVVLLIMLAMIGFGYIDRVLKKPKSKENGFYRYMLICIVAAASLYALYSGLMLAREF